ncbi:MAG: hypothetical protein N2745_12280 [Syntrophorhabdaceae bacterium]|nr:hypothetical protein [Syntrophorhabdaceae bacterium]
MSKEICSTINYKNKWYVAYFSIRGHRISMVQLDEKIGFDEVKEVLKKNTSGVVLNSSSGFLVHLKFPFGGRRKIRMVLNNELSSLLPFEIEDTVNDFQEIGKGSVLSLSVNRETLTPFTDIKNLKSITVNALASLYALRWFKILPQTDFIFLNIDGNVATIISFKASVLHGVRQFYFLPGSNTIAETVEEILKNEGLTNPLIYMTFSEEEGLFQKKGIEERLNIRINVPSPERYIKSPAYPPFIWPLLGSALLSLNPGGEINLSPSKKMELSFSSRLVFTYSAIFAAISLLCFILSSINVYSKTRVLNYLNNEQSKIFKTLFPKAPPIKDINRYIEERIKSLDKDVSGVGVNIATPPLQMLAEISAKIDKQIDVKIQEFICDDKEFSFSGTTVSFASVEKMRSAIEEIKDVKDVEIQSVDIAAGKQVKFRIRGRL